MSSQDEFFQNLSTVQSNQQPMPNTLASAATIAPSTFLTKISGTTDIATITPPATGTHMIALVFTNATPPDILTTGNVLVGTTTLTQNVPVFLIYDPVDEVYYVA
jgi:hypothetical protein